MLPLYCLAYPPSTQIYTLSLHDALPISERIGAVVAKLRDGQLQLPGVRTFVVAVDEHRDWSAARPPHVIVFEIGRHTSELQSHSDLVCRLLLEKKNFDEFGPRRRIGVFE